MATTSSRLNKMFVPAVLFQIVTSLIALGLLSYGATHGDEAARQTIGYSLIAGPFFALLLGGAAVYFIVMLVFAYLAQRKDNPVILAILIMLAAIEFYAGLPHHTTVRPADISYGVLGLCLQVLNLIANIVIVIVAILKLRWLKQGAHS